MIYISGKVLRYFFSIAGLIALPFFILVRGAVYFYLNGWTGYIALLLSSLLTMIVLLIYLMVVDRLLATNVLIPIKYKVALVFCTVFSFNIYGLVYFSKDNIKSYRLSTEYTQLHPLLRLAVSTVSYFDNDMVVTSMSRQQQDYIHMGLTPKQRSLHYMQQDGYVHAVDLRTKGRGMIKNGLTAIVFKLLGFNILRHVGNADHLHVALPLTH